MKFKIGDTVLVKENLKTWGGYDGITFNNDMGKLKGKLVTICDIKSDSYKIKEDECEWHWSEEMFEEASNLEEMKLQQFIQENLCLKNLNEYVKEKNITNTLLDEEIKEVIKGLNRFKKNNVLIIGKAGIGKTALVESLCQKINRHDVPVNLRDKKVIELSLGGLLAGTRYRGDFEEKLQKILQFATKREDIIFFIDEVHNLLDCGGAEGAIPAGEILKPYLARGEISIIGATTEIEYKRTIFKDSAMNRRFYLLEMSEPTIETTIAILKSAIKKYEKHYKIRLTDDEIEKIVRKSQKRAGAYPDKAFDELEEYCYQKVLV